MIKRLITYWVYGGALAGVLLLLLLPLLVESWSLIVAATFLLLPIYMIHQLEEHDNDRFRTFFNMVIGKGKEVLSPGAVFLINVPGVWGVIAISLYLTAKVDPGYSLIAIYLVIVNAVTHIVSASILRRYNPGTITAIVLFLPAGIWTLLLVLRSGNGTMPFQIIGLIAAIGIHAAIMGYVRYRFMRLNQTSK